jgi:Protein of unknown function (DUF1360)
VSPVDALLDVLATYRVTRLVVDDELTAPVREYIWKNHPPEETRLGYFVTCPFCVSIWAGGAVALMSATPSGGVFSGTFSVLKYTLALSGAVSLAREALDRLD